MTTTLFTDYRRTNPELFRPIEGREAFEDLRNYLSIYDLRLPRDFVTNVAPKVSQWFAHQSTYVFPVRGYPEIELAEGFSLFRFSWKRTF